MAIQAHGLSDILFLAHGFTTNHPRWGQPPFPRCSLLLLWKGYGEVPQHRLSCNKVAIHLGTQPNSSPHIGNITAFATGSALAVALKQDHTRHIRAKSVYVDSAPAIGQDVTLDSIGYQKSLGYTGRFPI